MGLKYHVTALGCRLNTESETMKHTHIKNSAKKCQFITLTVINLTAGNSCIRHSHESEYTVYVFTWATAYDRVLREGTYVEVSSIFYQDSSPVTSLVSVLTLHAAITA